MCNPEVLLSFPILGQYMKSSRGSTGSQLIFLQSLWFNEKMWHLIWSCHGSYLCSSFQYDTTQSCSTVNKGCVCEVLPFFSCYKMTYARNLWLMFSCSTTRSYWSNWTVRNAHMCTCVCTYTYIIISNSQLSFLSTNIQHKNMSWQKP